MKKLLLQGIFLFFTTVALLAQGDIDEQTRVFYRNERSFGLVLTSNGAGISFREGKRINFRNKRLFEADLNLLKHPKEIKLNNPYFPNNTGFVYGKKNLAFVLKGGIGYQHEMFRKIDLGGVAVRYFVFGGPSLAFHKPIYYDILKPIPSQPYEFTLEEMKFDKNIHEPIDIYARASFFKGWNETGLIPGAYAKGGISFEYSQRDKIIHAIEIGAALHAYLKEIPIMDIEKNQQFFLNLFVSYRFGSIRDPLEDN